VSRHKPGDTVKLEILRNGKPKTVAVTLAKRPATLTATQQSSQVP
jgi:S1-C subfamily serine protease